MIVLRTNGGRPWLAVIYLSTLVLVGLAIVTAPLPILLDRFIPDDAFYCIKTARIFVRTGFSSFDGLHFTNGYQPLWFIVSAAVFSLYSEGGEFPLRVLLILELVLSVAGALLFFRVLSRLFGIASALAASTLWVVIMHRVALNGIETALTVFLYAVLMSLYVDVFKEESPTRREVFLLGIISGLLFLARLDMGFAVCGIAVALFLHARPHGWKAVSAWAFAFVLPVALLAGTYLGLNFYLTGHFMPVSGAAKELHSKLLRQAALEQHGGSLLAALWVNANWIFRLTHFRFLLVGVLGPWVILALSRIGPYFSSIRRASCLWPFFLGATLSWLYYSLAFYGVLTQTLWYYAPHTLLCTLVLASLFQDLEHLAVVRGLAGFEFALFVGLVLGWFPIQEALLWAGSFVAGTLVLGKLKSPRSRAVNGILWVLCGIAWIGLYTLHGIRDRTWLEALVITFGLLVVAQWFSGVPMRRYGAVMVFVITLVVHFVNLRADLTHPPGHWNYHLYLGSQWARESTPSEATIWSGSSGILGYFSDRVVVNTDGLANDYDFLENVLAQGKLAQYCLQWDYAIDAFPDETLAEIFPEGCFLPVPERYVAPEFKDGDLVRRLRIFKMKCDR